MTTIQAQVPDPLAKQVEELAEQEKVTVDQPTGERILCSLHFLLFKPGH